MFASSEDRDLAARKAERQRASTKPEGVPVEVAQLAEQLAELAALEAEIEAEADEFDPQYTPVTEVLPIARTAEGRDIIVKLCKRLANQELNHRRTRNLSSEKKLRQDIDALEAKANALSERVVDISGKSGDNGKLGELKRRVDGLTTRIWSAIGSAVASLGAAAVLIWNTSGDYHDVKAAARAANDQIKILQAQVMTLQAAAISRGSRRAGGVGATAEQPATEPGKD